MVWTIWKSSDDLPKLAKTFARAYATADLPENDDPVDDFTRLLRLIISSHPSVSESSRSSFVQRFSSIEIGDRSAARARSLESLIERFGTIAATVAPGLTASEWSLIYRHVLSARYGGQRVRIKAKPAADLKHSARTMTPKQLMEAFGISRSYAYRLVGKHRK